MEKRGVTIFTKWEDATGQYKTKVVNVKIVIEEVTVSAETDEAKSEDESNEQ
jgi:hypothetical protein